jgi:iron complex outermembrane recepter protein
MTAKSAVERGGHSKASACLLAASMMAPVAFAAPQGSSSAAASAGPEAPELEVVLVTAQKRGAQALNDIPASISALSADDLARSGATSFQDLAGVVPGFAVFDTGPNQKKIKLRGVSGSSESEPNETVGVYLDDISITNPGGTNNENGASPDFSLYDVERIEVLKGPQGTLYGAGSMGGTVRYITRLPDPSQFAADARVRLGTTKQGDASYEGNGMLNLPLVADRVALRLVSSYDRDGGFIDNAAPEVGTGYGPAGKVPGEDNYNEARSWMIRSNLLADVTDAVRMQLKYVHRDVDVTGLSSVPRANELVANYPIEPFAEDEMDIGNLVFDLSLGSATLTSSTSYLERTSLARRDLTPLGRGYLQLVSGVADAAPPIGLYNRNRSKEFSQEVRLSAKSGRLQYVVGAYYSKLKKEFVQDGPWEGLVDWIGVNGAPAALDGKEPIASTVRGVSAYNFYQSDVDQDLTQVALFGEATYTLSDRWELTLGGRFFDTKQTSLFTADARAVFVTDDADFRDAELKEDGFNPKATLSFKPNDDLLLYVTAARGFRVGGFNQPVSTNAQCLAEFDERLGFNPNDRPAFKSDTLWSYELGAKSAFADRRAQLSGSVYHIDWKDIQLRNPLTCGFTFFDNASTAEIDGVEAAFSMLLASDFKLSLSGSYVDAKLTAASLTTGGVEGERLLGIPEFSGTLSAEYQFLLGTRLESYARVDVSHTGSYESYFSGQMYGGAPQNRTIGNYTIANLHVGTEVEQTGWSFELYVNNLTDELAATGAQNDIFGDVVFRNRPREIGLLVGKSF